MCLAVVPYFNSRDLALHVCFLFFFSLVEAKYKLCEEFIWVQPKLICSKERLRGADLPPPLLCEASEQERLIEKDEGERRRPLSCLSSFNLPHSVSPFDPLRPLSVILSPPHFPRPVLSLLPLRPSTSPLFLRPSLSVCLAVFSRPHFLFFRLPHLLPARARNARV